MNKQSGKTWRVGVVGLGLMGRRMLGDMQKHPGFRTVRGYDLDRDLAIKTSTEFGFESCTSVAALLEDPDLDLVYIATPPASHVELAFDVLERGRPLLLEKPLAVDLHAADQLVEFARGARSPAAVNFPFATLPGLRRIERELRNGTAGAPLRVEIHLHFSQWPRTWHTAGPWLAGDREGGFLREVFSHFAYLTQRVLSPLQVKTCSLERCAGQGETLVNALMQAGEVPVTLVGGAQGAAPDFNQWTLFCEARSYRVENWGHVFTSAGEHWEPLGPEAGESAGAQSQLDELSLMLSNEPHALPSLADALAVMNTVESLLLTGS